MTIKAGDKVLISSSLDSSNAKCGWAGEMANMVGKVFTVESASEYHSNRFSIKYPNSRNSYWFHESELSLVNGDNPTSIVINGVTYDLTKQKKTDWKFGDTVEYEGVRYRVVKYTPVDNTLLVRSMDNTEGKWVNADYYTFIGSATFPE